MTTNTVMQRNSVILNKKNQLWVNIVEAKNLLSDGPNNPYCKIVLGKNTFRTTAAKNTTSPKWDKTFFIDNFDPSNKEMLYIYVQRKAIGKSHVYGMISVDVSKLQPGETMKEWCPLQNKGGKTEKDIGQLSLVIKLEDIEKSSLTNTTNNGQVSDNEPLPRESKTQTTKTLSKRSESPVNDIEEKDSNDNLEKSKEEKDTDTATVNGSEEEEISDFASNIISNLQKEINELKSKLENQEKRKSRRIKEKMTDFFKGNKEKNTGVSEKNGGNKVSIPTEKPKNAPSQTEIFEVKEKVVTPTVTEEEEKAWISKNEFVIGNFFNSSEEDRNIIIQDTFDATPLEIFKFIFSDNTNFFEYYHKCREDYNIKIGKWEESEEYEKKREIEFTAPLNFKIGPSKTHNWETQRYHLTKEKFTLAIYSRAPEIMFGKYFQVEALWEFILIGERKTQLTIKFACPFSEYTVLKGTITKNAIKTYTDSHKMFIELSKTELTNCLSAFEKNSGAGDNATILPDSSVQPVRPEPQHSSDQQRKPPPSPRDLTTTTTKKESEWLTESNFKLIYFSNILVWIFIFFILFFKK